MTNRSDEAVQAPEVTAPMMHSMDFHAGMLSPQDKYRSIAPGQTITFEFTVNYPGVFMYHCGTPMILEHIASGMYGALIVEPREGYPTKVDRVEDKVAADTRRASPAEMKNGIEQKLLPWRLGLKLLRTIEKGKLSAPV